MKALTLQLGGRLEEAATRRVTFVFCYLATALLVAAMLGLTGCAGGGEPQLRTGTQNIRTQRFALDGEKGGVLQGAQGAIFAVPAGAFMDSMGNAIKGPVDIRIKEANRNIDILVGGLVTQAGNEMLASGGMYMVEARQGGKPILLNPAVGIYAYLPTDKKNPAMGLYKGAFNQSKIDWRLTGQGEQEIPECERDDASRKKCKQCERLAKLSKRIKPSRKPKRDGSDFYVDRHYWENGTLYFYSSGSKKAVLDQAQLDECKSYLEATAQGKELLAAVSQYKEEWKDRVGEYYAYRLNDLGWYNVDKVVEEELMVFKGRVTDLDGKPVAGATVHLYCKDADLKVHSMTTAEDGTYSLQFARGRSFMLYAYEKGKVGKQQAQLSADGQDVGALQIAQVEPARVEGFFSELL